MNKWQDMFKVVRRSYVATYTEYYYIIVIKNHKTSFNQTAYGTEKEAKRAAYASFKTEQSKIEKILLG